MITWKITKLTPNTIPPLDRVVIECEWQCTYKTDSVFRICHGNIKLPHNHLAEESMIAFDLLEETTVLGWVKSILGQETVDAIEDMQNGGLDVEEVDLTDSNTVWPAYWEGAPADPQYDEWGNLVDSEGNPIDEQGNPL